MTGFITKARTALALGLLNIAKVIIYRISLKLGWHPVRRLKATMPCGPFFQQVQETAVVAAPAVSSWDTQAMLFSRWTFDLSAVPPDWLVNPFNRQRVGTVNHEWWQIPDFDPAVGDIKLVWEMSRFDWVLAFAQRASKGDSESLVRLNHWLADWCLHNPPYRGPNWKCGQEASIRIIHLAMASLILGQVRTATSGLRDLLQVHLKRIAATLQYAIAQDNNHGTSEAAALFIGGSWLAVHGSEEGKRWLLTGRRWLENRADRLIGNEGSFSQHSLNYHRMMLDTFCMVEVWRRHMGLKALSTRCNSRVLSAAKWLRQMVNPITGDGPNLGANDGARLLQLADSEYRDYRPSVQLAMALFAGQRAYSTSGSWDYTLDWLGVALPDEIAPLPCDFMADDGGFVVIRRGAAMVLLRYPRFRFRPSHADALHLDLWIGSNNVLRDAGTYSYNSGSEWISYFCGTESHNTVQFDERDQMPSLSRFLFGDWLKTEGLQQITDDGQVTHFSAGYSDRWNATHHRQIRLRDNNLTVIDNVHGFTKKAVLRWRLIPANWLIEQTEKGLHLTSDAHYSLRLSVSTSAPVERCEVVSGWESRHYLEKTPVQVLELEVRQSCTLTTEVRWSV